MKEYAILILIVALAFLSGYTIPNLISALFIILTILLTACIGVTVEYYKLVSRLTNEGLSKEEIQKEIEAKYDV